MVDRLFIVDKIRLNQIAEEYNLLPRCEEDARLVAEAIAVRKVSMTRLDELRALVRQCEKDLKPLSKKRRKLVVDTTTSPSILPQKKKQYSSATRWTLFELSETIKSDIALAEKVCEPREAKTYMSVISLANACITECKNRLHSQVLLLEDSLRILKEHIRQTKDNALQNEYLAQSMHWIEAATKLRAGYQETMAALKVRLTFECKTDAERAECYEQYALQKAKYTTEADELLRQYSQDTKIDLDHPEKSFIRNRIHVYKNASGATVLQCSDGSELALQSTSLDEQSKTVANDPLLSISNGHSKKRKKQYRKSIAASLMKQLSTSANMLGAPGASDNISQFFSTMAEIQAPDKQEECISSAMRDASFTQLVAQSMGDNNKTKTVYVYKKENHMRDLLNAIQGKSNAAIPDEVISAVRQELHKFSRDPTTVDPLYVKGILHNLGLSEYYDHVFYIAHILNPTFELPVILKPHDDRIIQRLCAMEAPYERIKHRVVSTRRNFMSYPVSAFKCSELEQFLAERAVLKHEQDLAALLQQPLDGKLVVQNIADYCRDDYDFLTRAPADNSRTPYVLESEQIFDYATNTLLQQVQVSNCIRWVRERLEFLHSEIEHWKTYRRYFKFLKDGKLMKKQQEWFALICEELGWPQIKTVGNSSFSFQTDDKPWKYGVKRKDPQTIAAYNSKFAFVVQKPVAKDNRAEGAEWVGEPMDECGDEGDGGALNNADCEDH